MLQYGSIRDVFTFLPLGLAYTYLKDRLGDDLIEQSSDGYLRNTALALLAGDYIS